MTSNRSNSQIAPNTQLPSINQPGAIGQANQAIPRTTQQVGNPSLSQAITGNGGSVLGPQPTFPTQQSAGQQGITTGSQTQVGNQPATPAQPAQGASGGGSNVDTFMSMLQDPQYAGNAQAAVDAFNQKKLGKDSTGLSSDYGSSPAVYDNGNTIGLPDRYMTKNSDGTWTTTMRSGGSGQQPQGNTNNMALNELLQNLQNNPQLSALGGAPQGQSYSQQLLKQIQSALNVNPQLSAIGQNLGV